MSFLFKKSFKLLSSLQTGVSEDIGVATSIWRSLFSKLVQAVSASNKSKTEDLVLLERMLDQLMMLTTTHSEIWLLKEDERDLDIMLVDMLLNSLPDLSIILEKEYTPTLLQTEICQTRLNLRKWHREHDAALGSSQQDVQDQENWLERTIWVMLADPGTRSPHPLALRWLWKDQLRHATKTEMELLLVALAQHQAVHHNTLGHFESIVPVIAQWCEEVAPAQMWVDALNKAAPPKGRTDPSPILLDDIMASLLVNASPTWAKRRPPWWVRPEGKVAALWERASLQEHLASSLAPEAPRKKL